jgi:hypothetical protein
MFERSSAAFETFWRCNRIVDMAHALFGNLGWVSLGNMHDCQPGINAVVECHEQ